MIVDIEARIFRLLGPSEMGEGTSGAKNVEGLYCEFIGEADQDRCAGRDALTVCDLSDG